MEKRNPERISRGILSVREDRTIHQSSEHSFARLPASVSSRENRCSPMRHPTVCFRPRRPTSFDSNGATRSVTFHLDKREDGAWRFTVDKGQLKNRNIDFVDVKIPAGNATTGEDGYFITTTSAIGTFRNENGIYRTSRNYRAFFGMKTPRATWVAIVKKLNLEFDSVVEARHGNYRAFPRFCIGRMGFAPHEDIVVDFYPLKADDDHPPRELNGAQVAT